MLNVQANSRKEWYMSRLCQVGNPSEQVSTIRAMLAIGHIVSYKPTRISLRIIASNGYDSDQTCNCEKADIMPSFSGYTPHYSHK